MGPSVEKRTRKKEKKGREREREQKKNRENDGCPVLKMSALLSQHWRHSGLWVCLGSCWRTVPLNGDCKHAVGRDVLAQGHAARRSEP